MTRAIALGGIPKPRKPRRRREFFSKSDYSQPTGRASYRSEDGSDLPARVLLAISEYRLAYRYSKATKVYLGRREWDELRTLLRSELSPVGLLPISICGVVALLDNGAESRLEIA